MLAQIDVAGVEQAIAQIDIEVLESIVSRALSQPIEVLNWQITLLGGLDSSPMAGGVYRLTGTARAKVAGQMPISHEWDVVVKVLRSPAGMIMPDGTMIPQEMADDQQGFSFWQRESFVAQSDLGDSLPAGLSMPRYLGTTYISEHECWLWQTYLPPDHQWNWDDYHKAAYHLGAWQAQSNNRLHHNWLSQNWMASWVNGPLNRIFALVDEMNGYEHPLLRAYFAPEELAALQRLWAERQSYLDRLAQLPQTLCHLDAHRGNLGWQRDDLVMLDWAFVGEAAYGEELAAFVGATLLLDYVPINDAEQLERTALSGYIAGLRNSDWVGDEAQILEAYRCAMPLRYAPASFASMCRAIVLPEFATDWQRKTGKSLSDILACRAELVRFYLSR